MNFQKGEITISKEQYIKNPCKSLATAYWKQIAYPKNIRILHESDFKDLEICSNTEKYFRLFHSLNDIDTSKSNEYFFKNVNFKSEKQLVARILSECYKTVYSLDFIENLINTKVFDKDLWILLFKKSTLLPVALGIADFDSEICEGSLEWVQVLPNERGLGLGTLIVNELLLRLKSKAAFATVSGEVDNETKPEMLYRKCGFTGDDIWYVTHIK